MMLSHEPGTKVQLRRNVQRQIPVENKSAKLMCCNSICMQGSVTALLVNCFLVARVRRSKHNKNNKDT